MYLVILKTLRIIDLETIKVLTERSVGNESNDGK